MVKYNKKVEFCGKQRKFQRCPNKTLKDYQKTMEDIQEELIPLAKQEKDFQYRIGELTDEIEGINTHMNLLDKLENPTDDEIRESMQLSKTKTELQKKIQDIRKEMDKAEESSIEFYESLSDQLKKSYGQFASKVFEDFDESEIDEADSRDMAIAPRLADVYRLATSGASQSDVDKFVSKVISESFQ